jgi:hypothetical protein
MWAVRPRGRSADGACVRQCVKAWRRASACKRAGASWRSSRRCSRPACACEPTDGHSDIERAMHTCGGCFCIAPVDYLWAAYLTHTSNQAITRPQPSVPQNVHYSHCQKKIQALKLARSRCRSVGPLQRAGRRPAMESALVLSTVRAERLRSPRRVRQRLSHLPPAPARRTRRSGRSSWPSATRPPTASRHSGAPRCTGFRRTTSRAERVHPTCRGPAAPTAHSPTGPLPSSPNRRTTLRWSCRPRQA